MECQETMTITLLHADPRRRGTRLIHGPVIHGLDDPSDRTFCGRAAARIHGYECSGTPDQITCIDCFTAGPRIAPSAWQALEAEVARIEQEYANAR
jgi:hypothetical protein